MSRIQLVLCTVIALTAGACASSTAVPRPFPGAPVARTSTPPPNTPPAIGTPETESADADAPLAPVALLAPPPVAPPPPLMMHGYDGRVLAGYALEFQGFPYRFGGADPTGFDCSGFVQYVFGQYGINVPRVVDEQWHVGKKIKPSKIRPGDLLFFATQGSDASHVAIAVDEDRFVHAPNSDGVIRVEGLGSGYWGARYLGARRITSSINTN
jgi:NlpC/P60 family